MMDVVVLELWIRAVTRTPITIPATGLDKIKLLLKNCPATFPEKQTQSPQMWGEDRCFTQRKHPCRGQEKEASSPIPPHAISLALSSLAPRRQLNSSHPSILPPPIHTFSITKYPLAFPDRVKNLNGIFRLLRPFYLSQRWTPAQKVDLSVVKCLILSLPSPSPHHPPGPIQSCENWPLWLLLGFPVSDPENGIHGLKLDNWDIEDQMWHQGTRSESQKVSLTGPKVTMKHNNRHQEYENLLTDSSWSSSELVRFLLLSLITFTES